MADRVLPRSFFNRAPDAVAIELLGKVLVRRIAGQRLRARIVEVEAYHGIDDPAAHSASGRTRRNAVLFGPPGHAYVYLIYGTHWCLNVSTEPEDKAGCVLFRALEPIDGADLMMHLAPAKKPALVLSGPGRLTRALGITRELNGHDLCRKGDFYLAHDPEPDARTARVIVTPRIGITKAADRPRRYYLENSPAVTRPRGPVLKQLTLRG